MIRQQKLQMKKEIIFDAVKLAKLRIQRHCISCGASVKIDRDTGKPVVYHYVKYVYRNSLWIDIKRKEQLHECAIEKLCSYTMKRKIEMMMV